MECMNRQFTRKPSRSASGTNYPNFSSESAQNRATTHGPHGWCDWNLNGQSALASNSGGWDVLCPRISIERTRLVPSAARKFTIGLTD